MRIQTSGLRIAFMTRGEARQRGGGPLRPSPQLEPWLRNLAQRFSLAQDVPSFHEPVEIVVAGGTSLVGGFVEVFAQELKKVEFPLKVSGVRRANDALSSVVRGCLIAAALEQQ